MSAAATPKKTGAAKKKAPAPSHPPFSSMIRKAIKELKEKGGSSRSAILKYILANYKVGSDAVKVNHHLRLAIRREAKAGNLLQPKGPSGKIKLSEKAKTTKPAAKKPRAKKTPKKSPKKTVTKAATKKASPKKAKKSPKKAAKPKKTAVKKSPKPKKAARKSPKKAAKKSAKA